MTTKGDTDKPVLVDREYVKGINRHSVWVYRYKDRKAGIDRNFDVYGDQYHCFVYDSTGNYIDLGSGEGMNTKWYPTLTEAKKQVDRYLMGITREELCLATE
jgi:hypothetical protein